MIFNCCIYIKDKVINEFYRNKNLGFRIKFISVFDSRLEFFKVLSFLVILEVRV